MGASVMAERAAYRSMSVHERHELIVQLFTQNRMKQADIAKHLGCSQATVSRALDKRHVSRIRAEVAREYEPVDAELIAIRRIEQAMAPLTPNQRMRVLSYVHTRAA